MTDINNEHNQDAENEALNGLPEKERKETLEILGEIKKDSAPDSNNSSKPNEKLDQKSKEDKTKIDDEKGKADGEKKPDLDEGKGKTKPESRRSVKLIPAFIHEIEKDKFTKREQELLKEIATLKNGASSGQEGVNKDDKQVDSNLESEVAKIAEKHDVAPELVNDLIDIISKKNTLPKDISEKLAEIDRMKNQTAIEAEENAFKSDFEKTILPLIKTEYGPDVPASIIDQIREDLKAKAYSSEYEKVPFTVIYKGEDSFRGLVAPIKKGAEGGRGGTFARTENSGEENTAIDLTKPLSDEAIKGLSDKDFDTYCKNMETYERSKNKN